MLRALPQCPTCAGLIKAVRAGLRIPLHVLIRPRAGDFLYDAQELLVSFAPLLYESSVYTICRLPPSILFIACTIYVSCAEGSDRKPCFKAGHKSWSCCAGDARGHHICSRAGREWRCGRGADQRGGGACAAAVRASLPVPQPGEPQLLSWDGRGTFPALQFSRLLKRQR